MSEPETMATPAGQDPTAAEQAAAPALGAAPPEPAARVKRRRSRAPAGTIHGEDRGRTDGAWPDLAREALAALKAMEGKRVTEAGLHVAAAQLFGLLRDFNPRGAACDLSALPPQYAQLLNALARLSQCQLAFERHRAAAKETDQPGAGNRRALTEADLAELEQALNLM